jgi:hypothetical protein
VVGEAALALEELRHARGRAGGIREHGSVITLCGPRAKKLISRA